MKGQSLDAEIGIYCEAPLAGHLLFMKNHEAPVAPGKPLEAVAIVAVDGAVPDSVIAQLKENPAVRMARAVEL